MLLPRRLVSFNDTAPTEIYTLSLHDALPIFEGQVDATLQGADLRPEVVVADPPRRSEEHTSELQSHSDLVCRLLLEKKKTLQKLHELAHTSIRREQGGPHIDHCEP